MGLFTNFVPYQDKLDHPEMNWIWKEEPHTSRRQRILRKHPEIKKLMGYDSTIAYYVTLEVIIQIAISWVVQDWSWPAILVTAYCIGGFVNHSLGSAIHEIGHNLAFGHAHPLWNRALGMLANLPFAIPMSVSYKIYHADHHRFLGHDTHDVDVPTLIETWLFRNPLTKTIWLMINPAFHGIRPFYKSPKVPSRLEIINFVVQITFNIVIFIVFNEKALFYLLFSTLLGLGLHPSSGHFISEHYLFNKGRNATLSYYGPMNYITFNLGYHVEHHDFPYVPYTKIAEVKRIAPEFYDDLPHHTSWCKVIWDFIWDSDMGPQAHGIGYLEDSIKDIAPTKYTSGEPTENGHHSHSTQQLKED